MLFLWFYHACRRNSPRFLMVTDHINYLTFEDPGAVNTVRRALKLAHAGDLYGAAETAGVDVAHAAVVSDGLRRGMRYSIGAEVDNDPRARPDAQNIVDAMRPDGIIRSVHFLTIEHPEKGGEYAWPYDNPEFAHFFEAIGVDRVWELYVARLLEDIEKLPGHIVGHFYKPGIFGHWPDDAKLEHYENQLLDAALARGMAIEINTRPLYREQTDEARRKYVEVNKRLLRKAKAKNVPIAIGSDAHSPKDQGGGFDAVLKLLDECEINEIVFPVAGRLARVALRATKEHLEAHKTQEPAQPGSSISGLSRAELGLPEEAERTAEQIAAAKAGRDSGPKKRASSPARTTKKPIAEDAAGKTSSRRSPESAASSAKAKEIAGKPKNAKTVPGKTPTAKTPAAKAPAAKTPTVKAPAVKTAAAKASKAVKPIAAKPPAKKPVALKKPVVKAPSKPAAKVPDKKTPAKAPKTAVKPALKKSVPNKAASSTKKTSAKKPAAKTAAKPAPKIAPKPAPKAKKPAPKTKPSKPLARKPAAKKAAPAPKPAKKTSKPAAKGTPAKKKSTAKRR